jgi:hypothetical protein
MEEKSLVLAELREGGIRYRMLETVREYGWEQLAASGELTEVRQRHRNWYLQLAEQAEAAAHGPEQATWVTRLEAERDNLRAALAWCQAAADAPLAPPATDEVGDGYPAPADAAEAGLRLATALGWFWRCRGSLAEGLQWLEAPALYRAAPPAAAVAARKKAGSLLLAFRQEQEKALALARASGDRRQVADATLALAEVAHRMLDVDSALSYAAEARQQMEALGDRGGFVRAIWVMAVLTLWRGDRQAARPLTEELVSLVREAGDAERLSHALGAMGHLERDEGHYARARLLYKESLVLRRELGDRWALAQSLEDFAVLDGREQNAARAIRLLGAGEAFCETLDARPPVADRTDYERTVVEGRAALGEAAFAAAWAEGRAMSLGQAVEYALQ